MLKLVLALALLMPVTAYAANEILADPVSEPAPVAAPAIPAEEMKERTKLATDYHDLVDIREIINKDIASGAAALNPEEQEKYMTAIQVRIDYDKIEQLSIAAMANTFTVPELKALIAYFGSPEGKSSQAKMGQYIDQVSPEVRKAIDAALVDAQFGGQPAR